MTAYKIAVDEIAHVKRIPVKAKPFMILIAVVVH